MRSAAQIGECSVGVVCDGTVSKVADEFTLVFLSCLGEMLHCLGLWYIDADELLLLACKFEHLLLDPREVGIGNLVAGKVHVVIETVLDCRADTELHSREEFLKSLGHEV